MPHWIRWIPIKPKDLAGLHQLAKPTSFKGSLQPIQLGSTQGYLWEPGDHFNHPLEIIHGQEDFYKFIPCTSQHRIRRIPINTNLPYLEILAIQLQQLFFFQIRHDLSTLQAVKKVPRKLSYPLKPSRFKKDQILYLEPKFHKRLQGLVFDFFLSFVLFPFLFVLER